jgi:genome maintenance exonuclease 1
MAEHMVREGFKQVNEVWAIEAGLYYPGIYAGTTDSVGVHNGAESIMDYKQSNKPKKKEWVEDYFLQLAAYSEAHNEMFGTSIRKGVVMMMVKPETDQDGIVLLTEDGSPRTPPQYQEFILQGDEFEKYRQQWWHRLEQYYLQL